MLLVMTLCIGFSCERKPYVEHKLKFEKVSDDCRDQQSYFRLTANFGGERYEFEKCLPAEFKSDELATRRSNDTVYVEFKPTPSSSPGKVYHLILDIDSYPRYGFITIGDDTYAIAASEK